MNNHWAYFAVVFILSFLWQLIIYFNGGIDSPLIPIMMVFPAIVAIAFRIINKESFRNVGWGLRKWWYMIPSVMVPILIFLGWLYLRSKSIWMPALAHAAFNLSATLLFSELIMHKDDLCLQLMFIASWGVIAGLCLISLNRKKPRLWQNANGLVVNIPQK